MIDTEPRQRNTPETFGPNPEDRAVYKDLLAKLDRGEPVDFFPRFNAESVSKRIDDALEGKSGLGVFTTPQERQTKKLSEQSVLKLGQQRYIAAALGFTVGPTILDSATATASIEYPDATKLPARPQKGIDGRFHQADGTLMSQAQVDAIYSAHFIAGHPGTFKQPDMFRKIFERIREGALSGNVSMNLDTFADDKAGARSFLRQVTRLMGYDVDYFVKDKDSSVVRMQIRGTKKGFEDANTSFFDTFPKIKNS